MKTLPVGLSERSYQLYISERWEDFIGVDSLQTLILGRHCLIVSDDQVKNIYADSVTAFLDRMGASRIDCIAFPAGEGAKNFATLQQLCHEAVTRGIDRSSLIVALGGGVVGDMAGFLAAIYMRGISCLHIPTSLVAQVDSSIGGKTGVDLPEGKNLIGAFHQPGAVIIALNALRTLPLLQLQCGLAEVIKYGVIFAADFFQYLEGQGNKLLDFELEVYREIVGRCAQMKVDTIIQDERDEKGIRAALNYGHTFGHALEKVTNYTTLTHGEAIAIGMSMAADLAYKIEPNGALEALCDRQERLFHAVGLPTRISGCHPADILSAMSADKKNVQGKIRLILPTRIGNVRVGAEITTAQILATIEGRCD